VVVDVAEQGHVLQPAAPPRLQGRMLVGGGPGGQGAGSTQPWSRASSARRRPGGSVRAVRPTSSGRPSSQRIAPIWAPQHRARTCRAVSSVPCPVLPGGAPVMSLGVPVIRADVPAIRLGDTPGAGPEGASATGPAAAPAPWAAAAYAAAWARVSSLTSTVICGALPCRSGADPPSRAALQAATRPSIRRCAAVRVSSCPAGGLNASAAVRTIS
jgi:hypothetical protein